eukprot:gene24831-32340_t
MELGCLFRGWILFELSSAREGNEPRIHKSITNKHTLQMLKNEFREKGFEGCEFTKPSDKDLVRDIIVKKYVTLDVFKDNHCEELGIPTVTCSARVGTKDPSQYFDQFGTFPTSIDLVALKSISDEIFVALTVFSLERNLEYLNTFVDTIQRGSFSSALKDETVPQEEMVITSSDGLHVVKTYLSPYSDMNMVDE